MELNNNNNNDKYNPFGDNFKVNNLDNLNENLKKMNESLLFLNQITNSNPFSLIKNNEEIINTNENMIIDNSTNSIISSSSSNSIDIESFIDLGSENIKKKEKVKIEWDKNSGYDIDDEEKELKRKKEEEIIRLKPVGWDRIELKKQFSTFTERSKQWHLIEKCPECNHSYIFKRRELSSDPPKFYITCMSRPDYEVVQELKKKFEKDTPEYKLELDKTYCGKTFEIL
jgi:hypothetical protein